MLGQSGKYRLDYRLGGGGMAEVFIGSMLGAEGFQRRVAIKRVLPGFSDNPSFAQMFVSEAQISSRLAHPNIVSVLDFDRDAENRLFLVMELVEGKDLDGLASTGPLPIPVIIFVITEVLRGLGHAHDLPMQTGMRGIVHRDVSPHNVLLSWDGSVKVSDFGIAKARNASEATASVFIKGKPAYMSPEQANGQPLDGRSDLFAVGVMLWEMLVGRRLFVGEDTRATLAAVLFGQIPRPRQMRADLSKDLERVTMKLLERDLPARYATAEQAIDDLLACAEAPKNGRELLKRVLAERFPQEAPVRGSAVHGNRTPPQPHLAQTQAMGSGASYDSNAGATPVPMASIGAQRSAPTATIQPRSSGGGAKIALAIGGVLVAAIVTFAIVASVKGGKGDKAKDASAGSAAGGSGSAQQVAVAPPPPPPAPDAALPIDAAVAIDAAAAIDAAEATKKDAPVVVPAHAGAEKKGHLSVVAFPVMTVYIDKKKLHDTPVEIDLPAGKHMVRLVNAEQGKDETVPVVIEADHTKTIDRTH
ncbi:MAG: serine/threonine protein kinase [Deltaproteobacteria bacterium]|nr:serine/threonine protein kinase [Deltaproteobacteria bacterium]